ncbi:BT_2262 family domain-containing protein [Sunxiuqinia indica]|uniref:BT_2262 family domain-containing protein n=1 Tax=Sunxiuqinia indica TaxID=2692584 RepID=UPI0019153DF5|nr:BT_2262 family domain-containing protein [Sunxiuqinia indica]
MMKNKILYLMVFLLAIVGLSSCEDETTEGFTDITYYPTLEVLGEPEIMITVGSTYEDAGVVAELNGEDVTDQVEVTSNVDTSTGGVYSVNYKIENEEGFFVTGSRTVYVADPTPSIISTGIHTTAEGTKRFWFSSEAVVNFSGYDILIFQVEPDVFYISDFMGGYYDQRVGYGPGYAMNGYFKLNDDNTITPISSIVPAWGDSMDAITSSSVDPTTGQITYVMEYAGLMEYTIIIN